MKEYEDYVPVHFAWSEFDSKDANGIDVPGSGKAMMNRRFVAMLDELRGKFGKPMVVTSGYRFPEWNEKVSSTGRTGPHTTGKAVDIQVSGKDVHRLLQLAFEMGFTGVGIQQSSRIAHEYRFIHLDILTPQEMKELRPWVWSY